MNKNTNIPWSNEHEFYQLHSKRIFSKFPYYHTAMIGKDENEFSNHVIKTARINHGARVIDLGCGSGHLVSRISELCEGLGISNSPECIAQAKENYPYCNFEVVSMENVQHKGVTHFMALESIGYADIIKTLKMAFTNLQKNGYFYIKHFFIRNDEDLKDRENRKYFESWWKYAPHKINTFLSVAFDVGFRLEVFNNISNIANQEMFFKTMPLHDHIFELPHDKKEFLIAGELLLRKP